MVAGKLAVVTGGTSGLGFEISKQFLLGGVDVVALYVGDDKKAESARATLGKIKSARLKIQKLDVTDEGAVKTFFADLERLDFLVNCAGITTEAPFDKLPMADIKKIMDVNLYGKMNCAKYALPLLKKSKTPRIVNIASRFAKKPSIEGVMGYACSMAAIVMLTKVLALEWAKYGIRTNTISPSLTRTPLTEASCTQKEFDTVAAKNPCGRLGLPIDIASVVMFLCGEKSEYINGENINVNGGLMLI